MKRKISLVSVYFDIDKNTYGIFDLERGNPTFRNDDVYVSYREDLVDTVYKEVIELEDKSFMVKRHFRYVEMYRNLNKWNNLESIEVADIKEHISTLIKPKKEDELSRKFDYLIYSIDLGLLQSKNVQTPINIVVQTAEKLSSINNIEPLGRATKRKRPRK